MMTWRFLSIDKAREQARQLVARVAIPDMELAALVMIGALLETIWFVIDGQQNFQTAVLGDPLLWIRVMAYLAVAVSAIGRANRAQSWLVSIGRLWVRVWGVFGRSGLALTILCQGKP